MPFNFVHIRESLPPTFLRCVSLANGEEIQTLPKVEKWQTTKMFPVPNSNYPGLGSRRGKSRHLQGRQGTLARGTRLGQPQCGGTRPRSADAGRPPPAAGSGAASREAGKEAGGEAAPNQHDPRSRPSGQPRLGPTPPALQPRLTPPRRAAARPGPSRASCSADARGRAGLTRGGAWRARGRSAPSSPPRRGQRPAPRGRREDQTPTGLPPPPQLGLRQPRFPGEKKKHTHTHATSNAAVTSDPGRPTAARPGQASSEAGGGDQASGMGRVHADVRGVRDGRLWGCVRVWCCARACVRSAYMWLVVSVHRVQRCVRFMCVCVRVCV